MHVCSGEGSSLHSCAFIYSAKDLNETQEYYLVLHIFDLEFSLMWR